MGTRLDRLRERGTGVLHHHRIPRRGNIDHLVVTSTAVWVIHSYRNKGGPERVRGGLLQPRNERLVANGTDRTSLVNGVQRQVDAVREIVGDVSVRGVLCFVDGDWPLLGGPFFVAGVRVVSPRKLIKIIAPAESGPVDVNAIAALLNDRFKPA